MILIAWQCTPIRVAIIVYPLSSHPLLHWLSRQEPVSGGLWSSASLHAEVTNRGNLMPFRRLGAPLVDLTRRKAASGPCEKVSGRFFLMDECVSQWTGFLDTLGWVAGRCTTIAVRNWVHGVTMDHCEDHTHGREGPPSGLPGCGPAPSPLPRPPSLSHTSVCCAPLVSLLLLY